MSNDNNEEQDSARKHFYTQTSQYRHWRFSPSQLNDIRCASNATAVERVRTLLGEEQNLQLETNSKDNVDEGKVQYLTVDDELALCAFYEQKIADFCVHFQYPTHVKATAIAYMKRFFLHNTVMDYPPKKVMLTCLFLATKTENHFVGIEDFAKRIPKTTPESVLELEFTISQSLRFEYAIRHPHKALYGLYLDIQTHVPRDKLASVYATSQKHADTALFTDVCLLYTPAQIAWSCMRMACEEHGCDPEFQKFLHEKVEDRAGADSLTTVLDLVQNTLKSRVRPSMERVKEIDRRLIFCRNPEKNENSIVYKRKREQEEREKEEKRQKKIKALEEKENEVDEKFGPLTVG